MAPSQPYVREFSEILKASADDWESYRKLIADDPERFPSHSVWNDEWAMACQGMRAKQPAIIFTGEHDGKQGRRKYTFTLEYVRRDNGRIDLYHDEGFGKGFVETAHVRGRVWTDVKRLRAAWLKHGMPGGKRLRAVEVAVTAVAEQQVVQNQRQDDQQDLLQQLVGGQAAMQRMLSQVVDQQAKQEERLARQEALNVVQCGYYGSGVNRGKMEEFLWYQCRTDKGDSASTRCPITNEKLVRGVHPVEADHIIAKALIKKYCTYGWPKATKDLVFAPIRPLWLGNIPQYDRHDITRAGTAHDYRNLQWLSVAGHKEKTSRDLALMTQFNADRKNYKDIKGGTSKKAAERFWSKRYYDVTEADKAAAADVSRKRARDSDSDSE